MIEPRRTFASRRSLRRRARLALIGALSGLVGGFGIEVVLVQGGRVTAGSGYELPVVGLATGVAMAFLDLSERQKHVLRYTIAFATVMVLIGGFAGPATGMQTGCDLSLVVGDDGVPFSRDSQTPVVLDLGATDSLAVVSDEVFETATVEVTLASVQPFGNPVEAGEVVLYYGSLESVEGAESVEVQRSGRTGFKVVNTRFESEVIPFGLVELHATIRDVSRDDTPVVCQDTYWVRVVATPATSPIGVAAIAGGTAGLVGLAFVASASPSFVPPRVRHHRMLDRRTGRECTRLSAGSTYRLEIRLNAGIGLKDEEKKRAEIEFISETLEVSPSITIGLGPLPLSIEITPSIEGDHRIDIAVKLSGDVIGLDAISVTVAEAELEDVDPGPDIEINLADQDRERSQ